MEQKEMLIYLSYYFQGNWEKMYEAISSKDFDFDDPNIIKEMNKMKSNVVTMFDDNYPKEFYNIPKPPFVLYYYGNLSLLDDIAKNIAIIGTRKNSAYGAEVTRELSSKLAEDFVIVSGLAKGIDSIAHESCLDAKGKTIAVLGSGIDYCYPPESKELYDRIKDDPNSLIISEYPSSTMPEPTNFPERNRFIAGLSKALIVTEAFQRSGTSITTGFALYMGKTVLAVPDHAFRGSLCNQLISEGCRIIENVDDVYDEIGFIKFY